MSTRALMVGVVLAVTSPACLAQMCKWVDDEGCVHYAETCPAGVDGTEVGLQAPPTAKQVLEARQRSEQAVQRRRVRTPPQEGRQASLPLHELGPLPDNVASRYLATTSTGILSDSDDLTAQFTLQLQGTRNLARGSYVEARFPDPGGSGNKHVTGVTVESPRDELMFLSPGSRGFRCRNYEVEVLVFEDDSKEALLDTHRQIIQSRLDLATVRSRHDMVAAMQGKFCPEGLEGKSATDLEALCERAREQRLKPLRDKAIDTCINVEGRDPDYCRTYFSTYGDAGVRGNLVTPRYFDDLPECVAARRARGED